MTGLLHNAARWLLGREPKVEWANDTRHQLEPVEPAPTAASGTMSREIISQTLQATFPGAQTVQVLRLYSGYRDYANRFILLVDVERGRRPGRYVVKVGLGEKAQEIRAECNAWAQCWPRTVRHDPVLMPLA